MLKALPLRLHALGTWGIDPLVRLGAREHPADPLLLKLSREAEEPALACLAALLLGLRHRRIGDRSTLESRLPANVHQAWNAGLVGGHSPLLQTLVCAEGRDPLPPLVGIPADIRGEILRAAERAAIIHGLDAALAVLRVLVRPWLDLPHTIRKDRERMTRFEVLAQHALSPTNTGIHLPQEIGLVNNLRGMTKEGEQDPDRLTVAFLRWMRPDDRIPNRQRRSPFRRIAEQTFRHGLLAAVRGLIGLWSRQLTGKPDETIDDPVARLSFCLSLSDLHLDVPSGLVPDHLKSLAELLQGSQRERAQVVWPVVSSLRHRSYSEEVWGRLIRSDIAVADLRRIVEHRVDHYIAPLLDQPRRLVRYLEFIEELKRRNVAQIDPAAPWLVNLFRLGPICTPAVVLTVMRQTHGKTPRDQQPATLLALSRDLLATGPLAEQARALGRALEEWDNPATTPADPQLAALAALLSVEETTLHRYLHHRRLAGYGATFGRALLEPLELRQREAREIEFLRRRFGESPDQPHLAQRLARLTDPGEATGRLAGAVSRARHRLERSMEVLRQESLERVLDGVYRAYLTRLRGKPVPDRPLPRGLREALALLHTDNIDQRLFFDFIDDLLEGRSLDLRQPNRLWLDRARATGVDIKAWLAGVRGTIQIQGETLSFESERDPLHVLSMGTYFDTCLSLNEGMNAAATLVNALDVNKQVIYLRKADGVVVGRKLIGATASGELAGYRTYANQNQDEIRESLHRLLAEFANVCRLRLSDTATPEKLHPGFWYNDGNEPWQVALHKHDLEPPPPDWPTSTVAVCEWNIEPVLRSHDPFRAANLLRRAPDIWQEPLLYRILREDQVLLGREAVIPRRVNRALVLEPLAYEGVFRWLDLPLEVWNDDDFTSYISAILESLPGKRAIVAEGVSAIRRLAARREGNLLHDSRVRPSGLLALLPVEDVLELCCVLTPDVKTDPHRPISQIALVHSWANVVRAAWLRDRDPRPLVRALESDRGDLPWVVTVMASQERIAELAPGLRKRLQQQRSPHSLLALALGTQGQAIDGPRLLTLLEQNPDNLTLALAVSRTGHGPSAEKARHLFEPQDRLPEDPIKRQIQLAGLRELASEKQVRILRQLLRQEARQATEELMEGRIPSIEQLTMHLENLVLVGWPEAEGNPEIALRTQLSIPAFEVWVRDLLSRMQRRWHDCRQLSERAAMLARDEAVEETLDWWRDLRGRVLSPWERYPGIERELLHLAQRSSHHRKDVVAALCDLWEDDSDHEFHDRARLLMGILGEEIEPEAREAVTPHVLKKACTSPDPATMFTALTWLGGSQPMPDPMESISWIVPRVPFDEPCRVLGLSLQSRDESTRQAGRRILRLLAHHQPDGVLTAMELAAPWLTGETMENVVPELMDELKNRVFASGESASTKWINEVARQLAMPEISVRWRHVLRNLETR